MRKVVLLFVFAGFLTVGRAQSVQRKLDSLLRLNNAHRQEDSVKAMYFREIFRAYNLLKNKAKTELYIDSALLIASRLPRKNTLAAVYYRIGSSSHASDRLRALTYYNKAIETAKASGATVVEAAAQLNLGALYMDLGDFPKSLEAHEHALELFRKANKEDEITSCYMNISTLYFNMHQYVPAMEYVRKALKSFEREESPRGIPTAYEMIAALYVHATDQELTEMGILPANRLKEEENALTKGLKYALVSEDNAVLGSFYAALGRLKERQGNPKDAEKYYTLAIGANGGDIEQDSYAANLVSAGNFYVQRLNDVPRGLTMLYAALNGSRKMQRMEEMRLAYQALSEAQEKLGRFDSALFYFRQEIAVRDSIFSKEKEQDFTRRQLRMDFDVKEREYKSAQQLADATLKQQAQEILLRRQQLEISDKEKILQRLTFLQKQAELENQKKAQASLLRQEELKAAYEKKSSEQQIGVQRVQLSANQKVSAFLGVLAVVIFAAALFMYNSRQRTVKLNKLVYRQKAELEELVEVKNKIFSIVSHDMKGPVNNIIAFSTLLSEGGVDPERLPAYMDQIKTTLDHTSSLMENMLNWAASQMEGFTVAKEPINITPIVQHAVDGIAQHAQKKRVGMQNHVSGDLYASGDRNMIELIVRNLINNAVKFSKPDTSIVLSAEQRNQTLVFCVKDHGVGMETDKVNRINSSGSSSVTSTRGTAKEKGTGLGLMLCKHFAFMMGGKIHAESITGQGSTFSMALPAA